MAHTITGQCEDQSGIGSHWRGAHQTQGRLRQGELLGLRWEDMDLQDARLTVRHTLQRVEGELVLLEPKTERSRRTIALPGVVASALRGHRTKQKMERLVAGRAGSRQTTSSPPTGAHRSMRRQ